MRAYLLELIVYTDDFWWIRQFQSLALHEIELVSYIIYQYSDRG